MFQLISMIAFPLLIISGGLIYWKETREIVALVMALGMLPTLVSLTQYFWGPSSMVSLDNGVQIPDQSYLHLAQVIAMFVSIGTLASGVAFVVLACRVRLRTNSVT